jgi:hypothetical protein
VRFASDAELASRLGDAQRRLRDANDHLLSGLHPDGIAAIYGDDGAAIGGAAASSRSEILDATDPLQEAQRAHRAIHHALIAYQNAAERRRQLAAEVGELNGELIATLVAAGWSAHDASTADVRRLARGTQDVTHERRTDCIPRRHPPDPPHPGAPDAR